MYKPSDINTNQYFMTAFGHSETEDAARILVDFAQVKDTWDDFTKKEIDDFCGYDFCFQRLIGGMFGTGSFYNHQFTNAYTYIIEKDGKYQFSLAFLSKIERFKKEC